MKIKRIKASSAELHGFIQQSQADMQSYRERVDEIAALIREKGDEGVFELTRRFDGAAIDRESFLVTDDEIEEAYDLVDDDYVVALRAAIDNIDLFHASCAIPGWNRMRKVILPDKYSALCNGWGSMYLEGLQLIPPQCL